MPSPGRVFCGRHKKAVWSLVSHPVSDYKYSSARPFSSRAELQTPVTPPMGRQGRTITLGGGTSRKAPGVLSCWTAKVWGHDTDPQAVRWKGQLHCCFPKSREMASLPLYKLGPSHGSWVSLSASEPHWEPSPTPSKTTSQMSNTMLDNRSHIEGRGNGRLFQNKLVWQMGQPRDTGHNQTSPTRGKMR